MGVGHRHFNTATYAYNLAMEYEKTGNADAARPLYQRAAGIVVAMVLAGQIDQTHAYFQRIFGDFAQFLQRQAPNLTPEQAVQEASRLAIEEAERVRADHEAWEQQKTERDDGETGTAS